MQPKKLSSLVDQVADLLRSGMTGGRWRGVLPGRDQLARELGCSHSTVEDAMRRLSREGLLVSQGAGKRRRIVLNEEALRSRGFRVTVLAYERSDTEGDYVLNHLISRLRHLGHEADFAPKTLEDLGMNVKRIARYAHETDTDAWVVVAGPRDVLEWFCQQTKPAFALYGRPHGLPMASAYPNKVEPMRELVDRLHELGHRRIIMLARAERRQPSPGAFELRFLEKLAEKGIPTSSYNLPDWGDDPDDLASAIGAFFKYTPPTALIVDQPSLLIAVLQQLGRMGILVPEHVSLACLDASPSLEWCRPAMTHIAWDPHQVIKRMVKWVDNVSLGREDRRGMTSKARLVMGGTTGPAPKNSVRGPDSFRKG